MHQYTSSQGPLPGARYPYSLTHTSLSLSQRIFAHASGFNITGIGSAQNLLVTSRFGQQRTEYWNTPLSPELDKNDSQ